MDASSLKGWAPAVNKDTCYHLGQDFCLSTLWSRVRHITTTGWINVLCHTVIHCPTGWITNNDWKDALKSCSLHAEYIPDRFQRKFYSTLDCMRGRNSSKLSEILYSELFICQLSASLWREGKNHPKHQEKTLQSRIKATFYSHFTNNTYRSIPISQRSIFSLLTWESLQCGSVRWLRSFQKGGRYPEASSSMQLNQAPSHDSKLPRLQPIAGLFPWMCIHYAFCSTST